ncbi:MAG: hypothetical protein ABIV47_06650 [Roseiflexaceae bacterium]
MRPIACFTVRVSAEPAAVGALVSLRQVRWSVRRRLLLAQQARLSALTQALQLVHRRQSTRRSASAR